MILLDRRTLFAGLAAFAATPASAGDKPSPIATGALAQNSLAQKFEAVTTELPDVTLWGPNGKRNISELKGRTILMPIWAEWCAPCLSELPDFARLQKKYGNDKFAIVPVMSGSRRQFTPDIVRELLKAAQADVFEPLLEDHVGAKLFKKMANIPNGLALPCNLLIAPSGHVVAREMGRIDNSDEEHPARTEDEILSRTQSGAVQSRWGQADGDQFAQAMANGFLA